MKPRHAALALAVLGFCLAADSSPIIARVDIHGNHRVSEQAIRDHISSKVGEPFDADRVDVDIKALYHMGNFNSVHVALHQGNILVFTVDEKSSGAK